jgi:hypothetical protein
MLPEPYMLIQYSRQDFYVLGKLLVRKQPTLAAELLSWSY